ncbi:MAG: TatD family hydrolase [Syntrophobacteraceae bacterium]
MENLSELIDTHAHLDFPEFADFIPTTVEKARKAGVSTIITIGIDIASSRKALRIAENHERIYATAGIHPHDAFFVEERDLEEMERIAASSKVVAIGEIGLDYFRDKKPRRVQRECLRRQMGLASRIGKPVVFHIRDAWEDFFRILHEFAGPLPASVLHCFSGNWEIAVECLKMGFFLSIPGVVTFPKAAWLHDVVKRAPLDRLLVETDAPYLAPVPYRGKSNEPAFVLYTAEKIAELRETPLEKIAEATTRNARAVFRL